MTTAVSSVALATGMTLSYGEAGDPMAPAVVFLPGPTDSWRSYEPVLDHFPPSVRAIAVSQRGHGDSDKPPTGYRVEELAADLPLFLDALGVDHAVVAAHSGSCLVVRRVAIDHPERVAGLVLEASPATLRGNTSLAEFVDSIVSNLQDPIERTFARAFIADTSSDQLSPAMVDLLTAEVMKVPAHVWKELFAALLAYDDLDEIDLITAPTLLVWGDADGLVDHEAQTTLAGRIEGAELLVYSGIGHTPRWDDPNRFAVDVADFAQRALQRRT
jgi:non-heme chloroperoxidase